MEAKKSIQKNSFKVIFLYLLIVIVLVGFTYCLQNFYAKNNTVDVQKNQVVNGIVLGFYNNKTAVKKIDEISFASASMLPQKLIIEPGVYQVYGKTYKLEDEGLYRFLAPGIGNEQRIVYKSNVDSLMSGISWVSSHGTLDNSLKIKDLEKKSLSGKIIVTCNKISDFAKYLLDVDGQKIESRVVAGSTAGDLNGFDDTHAMVEIKKDGIWQVYDLDNNVVFRNNGKYLNYLEMQSQINSGNYQIEKISADTSLAINNFSDLNSGYDYSFYGEETMYSELALKDWYKRVLQVFFIKSGSNYYYYEAGNNTTNNFGKNYIKITKEEFYKKFYN